MKFLRKASCLAALLAYSAEGMTTAESSARTWLMSHQSANPDELAELKAANPSAYAIVSALLTKQRMGLLDPRHPSASFAAPKQQEHYGPEVYKQLMGEPKLAAVSESYDVSSVSLPAASQHQDWLNWKPASSAMDDDAIVKDVIGAAPAEMAAAPSRGFLASALPAVAAKVQTAPAGNPYLQQADLGLTEPSKQVHTQMSAISKAQEDSAVVNPLSSFSWGDVDQDQNSSAPQQGAAPMALSQQQQQVQAQTAKKATKASPLMAWLSGDTTSQQSQQNAQQPAQQPSQVPATDSNSYLADLN